MAAVNSRKRGAAERPLSAPFSFRSRESGQIGLIERRGARRRSFKVWSKTMLKKIFSGIAIAAMMATTAAPTAALAHDRGKHHWHKKSEEYTSELQSLMRISSAVFCFKKQNRETINTCNTEINQ